MMKNSAVHGARASGRHAPAGRSAPAPPETLRDFTADRRLLALVAVAPVVGIAGAIAAWLLFRLINLATNLSYFGRVSFEPVSIADSALGPAAIAIPVAGCLVIGFMARYGTEKIRGHGIPEAIEAILIGRSRIAAKVAILKPLSSAISIGTGGPFGAEGPIIMTGGACGSLLGQALHLTNPERKTLLVAGAAAGMAATFGTPVAAMLLAVELLLFEWKPRSFIPVAVAAIVAAVCRPWLLGAGALFPLAPSPALPAAGLLFAGFLGVTCGLLSGLLTQMVYRSEDLFQRLPIHWMWWPAIGGTVVGVGGWIEPHALGVGYDSIGALLHGALPQVATLRLAAVKAIVWSIALGSGTSGGVLAPLLIMGGAAGALLGDLAPTGASGLWALVGMAAMMGGTMRSPLTAIVFAVEITQDLGALMPLAAACTAAHATTVLMLRRSILTEKLARRGTHVMREYGIDPFEFMRVSQVMAAPVESLPGVMPVREVIDFFAASGAPPRHKCYPVLDKDGRVLAMVSRAEALGWAADGPVGERRLRDVIGDRGCAVAYEDELVGALADRMTESGANRVPVLRRGDDALVGLVARRDLLRVRAHVVRHERERERLLQVWPRRRRGPEAFGGGREND